MADFTKVVPFILHWEGGYQNDKDDLSGSDTNKGITRAVWNSIYGTGDQSNKDFMAMPQDKWNHVFKSLYWDKIYGDQLVSQNVANLLVDFVWASGTHFPVLNVQDILIHAFGEHIAEDGSFGPGTLKAINEVDQNVLYKDIIAKRFWYIDQIILAHPTQIKWKNGWTNRINSLVNFNATGIIK